MMRITNAWNVVERYREVEQRPFDAEKVERLTFFEGGPFRFSRTGAAWRILIIPLIAWLPLLVLSILDGLVWSGTPMPFLRDIEAQARLLAGLPLLLWSESYADQVLAPVLKMFVVKGIVQNKDRGRFQEIVTRATRWSRSPISFLVLVILVAAAGRQVWKTGSMLGIATWYGGSSPGGPRWTLGGFWYTFVSIPIFQFILYRWYLRLIFWWGLMLRVSALDLHLVPIDPDEAGGIGFLGVRLYAFAPFMAAQGAVLSAILINKILYDHLTLPTLWPEIVLFGVFALTLVLGPLTTFSPLLIRARRRGRSEYGLLSNRYARRFEGKWILSGDSADEDLLGSPDIQSLADLANGAKVVRDMRFVPYERSDLLLVAIPFLLPVAPLLFTVYPMKDIALKLIGLLL